MAMALRVLISKRPFLLFSTHAFATRPLPLPVRFRPLVALADRVVARRGGGHVDGLRCFSTSRTASSLNDPSPNWSNRPPKETILLDGCDFEHWLVVVDPPDPSLTRDEIIQSYIKTLAKVIGSEEEARFKIYSVSTKHYFAFGALVSEELSYKIKELPGVRWVLPDSYLDVKNKDYGGEPFINGEAVPYDPKYHEEWVRNNARANERNRRNDRPRNSDRSRNFERRRENMQNFQNRASPPPPPPPPMQSQDLGTNAVQSSNPSVGMHRPSGDFGGYQNQVPNYQGGNLNQSGNLPQRDGGMAGGGSYPPSGNAYPGPPNAYQGAPGGYQGPPNTNQGGGGAYQGNPNAYQGVAGGYQGTPNAPGGGATGYQGPSQGGYGAPNASQGGYGAPNAPQGGRGSYQGAPYASQGGTGGYQGAPYAPQGGGPGGYQRPPSAPQGGPGGYQGPPSAYQGGSYQGSGGSHADHSYQGDGGSTYQGRDIPGRDQ